MKKLEMCPWKNTELWLENSSPILTSSFAGFVTIFEIDKLFDKYRYIASNEEGIIKHRALFSKTALDGFGGISLSPTLSIKLDQKDLILYTNLTVHSSRFWELLNDNNL